MSTRPIKTYYGGSDRVAHATTPERAVRAAAIRLIKEDYTYAEVRSERGKLIATLRNTRRAGHLIMIHIPRRNWK